MEVKTNSGSFRDPSGFVFERNGTIFRQINTCYRRDFEALHESGLLRLLQESGVLVIHEDVGTENAISSEAFKIIKPERIPFISYPYEWSFSQLKDAALLTLSIQKKALEKNLSLKDASTYNIQFKNGKPIFIDTTSFEHYVEGKPWVAYGQFCQHFLAPLSLMSTTDVRLSQLLKVHLDGVPLDLTSRLLPFSTLFRPGLFFHLHLHASFQRKYAAQNRYLERISRKGPPKIARAKLLGIIENLKETVQNIHWKPSGSHWIDYDDFSNYTLAAISHKKQIVEEFLTMSTPKTMWDLGANKGTFSRIACSKGTMVIAFDSDCAVVEKNYLRCKADSESMILPLVMDLTNPSSAIGWNNSERQSMLQRGPADMALALALIHHLCIGNNLSFKMVAEFLSAICTWLILEFVPKDDSQTQRLLRTRKDIYCHYNKNEFVGSFGCFFHILSEKQILESKRSIFFMKRKQSFFCQKLSA